LVKIFLFTNKKLIFFDLHEQSECRHNRDEQSENHFFWFSLFVASIYDPTTTYKERLD